MRPLFSFHPICACVSYSVNWFCLRPIFLSVATTPPFLHFSGEPLRPPLHLFILYDTNKTDAYIDCVTINANFILVIFHHLLKLNVIESLRFAMGEIYILVSIIEQLWVHWILSGGDCKGTSTIVSNSNENKITKMAFLYC